MWSFKKRDAHISKSHQYVLTGRTTESAAFDQAMSEEHPAGLEPIKQAVVGETLYVAIYSSFGIVRFVGETEFSKGAWVGLELPTPTGKNDGSVQGKRYFQCQPQHGIFVRSSACSRRAAGGAPLPPVPPERESRRADVTAAADTSSRPTHTGVQVLGSLAGAAADSSDSSEEDEGEEDTSRRPLSPPLNLSSGRGDDSEGELEVCAVEESPAAPSHHKSQRAALDAYLAAEEARKAPGLSLVSAMELSVNSVIGGAVVDAFGTSSGLSVTAEDITVAMESSEPDMFGIAYKPFKKTIAASQRPGPTKKTFEDEEEFEKDLQYSVMTKEVKLKETVADDEFDFDTDCPSLDSSQLRRTLEAVAEEVFAVEAPPAPALSDSATTAPASTKENTSSVVSADGNSEEHSYDAYGDAKDALRAIVDIYGCGLGDQEIVIMNSLGEEAVSSHASATPYLPTALGASIVPGTGTVSKAKSSKRNSGTKHVRSKIEREKIVEEDEEDYEQREKELEEASAAEELRTQKEVALLESEWQGVATSPGNPVRRKSFNGRNSPVARTASSPRFSNPQLGSPMRISVPASHGATDDSKQGSKAYDTVLAFFKSQNLTQFHSEIITSSESKGSWLLGGNTKLSYDGCDDDLKFCFSVAHVNYDPIRHREHFAALKEIYKFFVPVVATPAPGARTNRNRDVGMVGEHWGNIGFQGLDPCTDINRSMKMLAVLQVLNLIQEYPGFARCLHKLSQHSIAGEKIDLTWPFFCVSIGFTRDALQTLRSKTLNKRCNKFKNVLTALHEFYRACFFTFAKDVVEKPSIHHAHHISALRSAVENAPANVLKGYKTFIKKKCAKTDDLSPQAALCMLFDGHPCGTGSPNGDDLSLIGNPGKLLETEDLEFIALDEIKDSIDNRSPSPDKMGGGLFSMGRKKGYET